MLSDVFAVEVLPIQPGSDLGFHCPFLLSPDDMDLYGTWDAGNDSGRSTPVPGDHDAPASSDGGQALQRELEQMGSVVSGMGKTLGSYWGGFRRQVSGVGCV